jgi:hypothetical protein
VKKNYYFRLNPTINSAILNFSLGAHTIYQFIFIFGISEFLLYPIHPTYGPYLYSIFVYFFPKIKCLDPLLIVSKNLSSVCCEFLHRLFILLYPYRVLYVHFYFHVRTEIIFDAGCYYFRNYFWESWRSFTFPRLSTFFLLLNFSKRKEDLPAKVCGLNTTK